MRHEARARAHTHKQKRTLARSWYAIADVTSTGRPLPPSPVMTGMMNVKELATVKMRPSSSVCSVSSMEAKGSLAASSGTMEAHP